MATRRPVLTAPFSGAVLCGGASRRMGRDKATLDVGGTAMAARVAEALRSAGAHPVVAVGGEADALARLGLEVLPDDEPGQGPLPATLTALRWAPGDLTAVLSCDLLAPSPTAIATTVERLTAAPEVVVGAVPVAAGHRQWTHAVWRRAALPALEGAQRAGARSLQAACRPLRLVLVHDLDPSALADADHPRDLPGGG